MFRFSVDGRIACRGFVPEIAWERAAHCDDNAETIVAKNRFTLTRRYAFQRLGDVLAITQITRVRDGIRLSAEADRDCRGLLAGEFLDSG
ncbi:MAG: hypothetical protein NTW32_11750 [Chloroflexi bacterium]|nr:hypothetical protein [Chloroflexota bacterium]